MRLPFSNRQELLELLAKFRWVGEKELTGIEAYHRWKWVVFDEGNQTKWTRTPTKVVMYLDRHEEVKGFLVVHGALDSYIINGYLPEKSKYDSNSDVVTYEKDI